jgi:hypothetical protein
VQLLPAPYPRLCDHCSTSLQTHKARFQIPVQSTATYSPGGFQDTSDPTVQTTSNGLSQDQLELPIDHRILHPGSEFTRRPMRNLGTENQQWQGSNQ